MRHSLNHCSSNSPTAPHWSQRKLQHRSWHAGRSLAAAAAAAHHSVAGSAHSQSSCYQESAPDLPRRTVLGSAALFALAAGCRPRPAAADPQVLAVGPGQQYQTISAAVDAAAPGATVLIDPGRYNESIIISKSITLQPSSQQEGSVEVWLDTQQPYQHCLLLPAGCDPGTAVTVKQLRFRHYSKSVANNYAVFAQGGVLQLEGCDVSSRSGVGVGLEGATLLLRRCAVSGCERHGVAVFGSLEGGRGSAEVVGCAISSNRLNGLLVRDGGGLVLTGSSVTGNGGYGLQLQDCAAEVSGNTITGNAAGCVAVLLGSVEGDLADLAAANRLDGEVALL